MQRRSLTQQASIQPAASEDLVRDDIAPALNVVEHLCTALADGRRGMARRVEAVAAELTAMRAQQAEFLRLRSRLDRMQACPALKSRVLLIALKPGILRQLLPLLEDQRVTYCRWTGSWRQTTQLCGLASMHGFSRCRRAAARPVSVGIGHPSVVSHNGGTVCCSDRCCVRAG